MICRRSSIFTGNPQSAQLQSHTWEKQQVYYEKYIRLHVGQTTRVLCENVSMTRGTNNTCIEQNNTTQTQSLNSASVLLYI